MNLILNILKTIPLFQSLSEEAHETIIQRITMEYFPTNHVLFQKGDQGDAMYIIKTGSIQILDGDKQLAQLEQGSFFGEMSLIENQLRNASARTLTECEVFILKREEFEKLMQETPEIAAKIQETYNSRK
jgi:CRP/FNR family cyclic AMP-dependent transcriptional regulator